MKNLFLLILLASTHSLLAESREEFVERVTSAFHNRDKTEIFDLYHLESLDEEALEFLNRITDMRLDNSREGVKQPVVIFSPVTNRNNFKSYKGSMSYPSHRPTAGKICLRYENKEGVGATTHFINVAKKDDRFYLISSKFKKLDSEGDDTRIFRLDVVNDNEIENLPRIVVTVMESEVVNICDIPFGSGNFQGSKVLSIACPPIPSEDKIHLRIVDARDESFVLIDKEFDGAKGIFWLSDGGK